ncbi:hypothetical protein ACFLTJ_04000 [Chloroflexota bacterium]
MDVSSEENGDIEINGRIPHYYPHTLGFDYGSTIPVKAVPAPGYHFVKWDGEPTIDDDNPINIRVIRSIEITAIFAQDSNQFPYSRFSSDDGIIELFVPDGTVSLDKQGNPITDLELSIDSNPPIILPNGSIIGQAYALEPDGATFDPPISLTWSYQSSYFSEGIDEMDLYVAYYSDDTGEWIALESVVDPLEDIITVSVAHLTTFAVLAPPTPPTSATFEMTSLNISPNEVDTENPVTISALLMNTGEIAGSYMVILKINGVKEETKEVNLIGGTQREITFTISQDIAGTYVVYVGGLIGSFTVTEAAIVPSPPPSIESPPQSETPQSAPSVVQLFGTFVKQCIEISIEIFRFFLNAISSP